MLTHSDFCTFILSHGRPNNIRTLHPLLNTGNYSGPWYIVIDNEDPTAETYYQLYGSNRESCLTRRPKPAVWILQIISST